MLSAADLFRTARIAVFPENPSVFRDASRNDPYMAAARGLVRDSQTLYDARFSCREVNRIVGIALDQAIAALMG